MEVNRHVPRSAAVESKIIRLTEGDHQHTVYHQLASNRRPKKWNRKYVWSLLLMIDVRTLLEMQI